MNKIKFVKKKIIMKKILYEIWQSPLISRGSTPTKESCQDNNVLFVQNPKCQSVRFDL